MDCSIYPKKDACSGAACYYDYYPKRKPDLSNYETREFLKDKIRAKELSKRPF